MSLPQFQSNNRDFQLFQNAWASQLNPLLQNPLVHGLFLKNIALIMGTNMINHLLGRKQQGYIITDINASAVIYRSSPFNAQTLTLTSNGGCVVNIYVF